MPGEIDPANAPGGPAATGTPDPATQPGAGQPAAPVIQGNPSEIPAPKGADDTGRVSYEQTSNTGLNVALEFIGGLGIGPDNTAMVAAMNGEFGQLEGLLAGMGDKAKGYQNFLALAKQAHGDIQKEATAQAAENAKVIYAEVGGEANWAEIRTWAQANAEPEEREAVNKALGAGGLAAKAMASYLGQLYSKASGVTRTPASAVQANARTTPDGAGEPIGSREYGREVYKLSSKNPSGFRSSPEFKSLERRFFLGQQRGME